MKLSKIAIATAALAATAFAATEFMPIPQGKVEAAAGLGYVRATSEYDADGKSHDYVNGGYQSAFALAARGAYGVIPNLEAYVEVPFIMASSGNDDHSEDYNGLSKPIIGAKYGMADLGIAGFLELALPFGGEDIVGKDPAMDIALGVIADKMINQIQARGGVSYTLTLEDGDKKNTGDEIQIDLLPGYAVSPNLIAELNVNYSMSFEDEYDGEARSDSDADALTVGPGVLFKMNETTKIEALTQFTLMGTNTPSFWGAQVAGYFQF